MAKLDVNMLKEDAQFFANCLAVREKLEKAGEFNANENEISYEGCLPIDENYDYFHRGLWNKIKRIIYMKALRYYTRRVNRELINLKVVGRENLKGVKGGVVTCNHISKVDSFAVRGAVGCKIKYIAGDYHNWKGVMGDIARNTGYIPLPPDLNRKVMRNFTKAVDTTLQKNQRILIYPEQAMWREYKKPRPLKNGAFHYAVKNNRPVIPLFITLQDKPAKTDAQGRMNFADYTIHILPAIYPQANLTKEENIEYMKNANYQAWCDVYEKTYHTKLD